MLRRELEVVQGLGFPAGAVDPVWADAGQSCGDGAPVGAQVVGAAQDDQLRVRSADGMGGGRSDDGDLVSLRGQAFRECPVQGADAAAGYLVDVAVD